MNINKIAKLVNEDVNYRAGIIIEGQMEGSVYYADRLEYDGFSVDAMNKTFQEMNANWEEHYGRVTVTNIYEHNLKERIEQKIYAIFPLIAYLSDDYNNLAVRYNFARRISDIYYGVNYNKSTTRYNFARRISDIYHNTNKDQVQDAEIHDYLSQLIEHVNERINDQPESYSDEDEVSDLTMRLFDMAEEYQRWYRTAGPVLNRIISYFIEKTDRLINTSKDTIKTILARVNNICDRLAQIVNEIYNQPDLSQDVVVLCDDTIRMINMMKSGIPKVTGNNYLYTQDVIDALNTNMAYLRNGWISSGLRDEAVTMLRKYVVEAIVTIEMLYYDIINRLNADE